MIEKYSLAWLKDWSSTDYDFYEEVKELVYKRHKLIEPPCGCYGRRVYNKIKHKAAIKIIEDEISILTTGTSI